MAWREMMKPVMACNGENNVMCNENESNINEMAY